MARRNTSERGPNEPIRPPLTQAQYRELLRGLHRGKTRAYLTGETPKYALKELGSGLSRIVYELPVEGYESTALKVQRAHHRMGQTLAEVTCVLSSDSPFVPEIYEWGPKGRRLLWVEMELLTPTTLSRLQETGKWRDYDTNPVAIKARLLAY